MSDLQGFLFQRWPSAVMLVADVALRGLEERGTY